MSIVHATKRTEPPLSGISKGVDHSDEGAETPRLSLKDRLDRAELRRRVWHMAPGLLPFVLWFVPHADPLSVTLRGIMILIAVVLGTAIYVRFRRVARNGIVDDRAGAILGYAGSVLLTLLLFPADAELGLTVLAVFAFGDGSATLGGLLLGGPRLPWNREKTWAGLLSFLAVGGPMAALIYWGEPYHNPEALNAPVPFPTALLFGGVTTIMAAAAESIPSRINDNIRVGVASAVTIAVLHAVLIG